jgi:hypothetical protein
MPSVPHDYTDLFLAPVALSVDERLERLGELDRDALHRRVVLESNNEAWGRSRRGRDVVHSAIYLLDMHGWSADWDPRGVRLSHGAHTLVLGLPENVTRYVAELPED